MKGVEMVIYILLSSQDGVVVVWHDEQILNTKCKDTKPAVGLLLRALLWILIYSQFSNDPAFPYVGKFIANLTLAQVKTLDCGSLRLIDFRESTFMRWSHYSLSTLSHAVGRSWNKDLYLGGGF